MADELNNVPQGVQRNKDPCIGTGNCKLALTMTFTPPRKEQEFTLHVGKQFDHHAVRASACDGSIADTPSAISLVLKSTSSA